ncbi:MAG: hypothetical protein HY321_04350 [Armatimonadetes bacterium]|nr:hypothetical protein [Armatimonadota bacterium]
MKLLLLLLILAGGVGAAPPPAASARGPAEAHAGSVAYRLLPEPAEGPFDLSTRARVAGTGEVRLCFGYRDPQTHDYVALTARTVSLVRVRDGKARGLLPPYRLTQPLPDGPVTLTVKRRLEKISVLCRGTLVLVAGDLDPGGESRLGVAATVGARADDPDVQPVEPPFFADDFMRNASEASPWESALGTWSLTTVGDAQKSANGFCYRGSGSPGLAAAGFPFWDDYVLHASVKCAGEAGALGLGLYYQDPKNYLALVWDSADGLYLERVVGGTHVRLARKPVAWIPNQWYRLSVQALDGTLAALVDGKVCLEARNTAFGRGKAALIAQGAEVYFDDLAVRPAIYFHEPDPASRPERWIASGHAAVAGSPEWQDYTCRARVFPAKVAPGILFGWRDPRNYYVFRWDARPQIVRVAEGRKMVVSEAPATDRPGRPYGVAIHCRPGYAQVALDGRPLLDLADTHLTGGAAGLSPMSPAVKDFSVLLHEGPGPPEEEITEEFTNSTAHPDMAEWANPARAWVPRLAPEQGVVFWRKGEFFGDTAVSLTLPDSGPPARVEVSLAADGDSPRTGYTFVLTRPEKGLLAIDLKRQGTPVSSARITAPAGQDTPLTLARQGPFVVADVGEKRVLKYRELAPLIGSRVAAQVKGLNLDLKKVGVRSRNTYDYTFANAPTDWQPQAGTWEITSRWSCSPGWSWFGGRSERLAAIWNKRRFEGDLVLEYYAAPKMDAVAEVYAERFRDLNATICGDGVRLNSGYSVLVGGWRNQKIAILRGDRVVAEDRSYRLPPQKTGHRMWFYVRVEKHGNRISLSVDNNKPLVYEDPDPLEGDRVALWTQKNGLMLARVVISYQREKELQLAVRPSRPAAPAVAAALAPSEVTVPLRNDFEQGMAQWRGATARLSLDGRTAARGKRSLAIENGEPGGEFKAVAIAGTFDVCQAGRLSFDYRVPPDVRVNLYVRIGRVYYAIGFTGQGQINLPFGVLATLGKIEGVKADDAWHRASFDLLGALRRPFQTANPLIVEEVVLANWDPSDDYVISGVMGNGMGARYYLDEFSLGPPAPELVATRQAPAPALTARAAAPRSAPPTPAARPAPTARPATPVALAPSRAIPPAPRTILASPAPQSKSPAALAPRSVPPVEAYDGMAGAARWDTMAGKWAMNRKGHFAPTDAPEFAYAFTGDPTWGDYTVIAELINGQDAGLCVRALDWDNCVFIVIRPAHRDGWWFVRREGEWGGVLSPMKLDFDPKPRTKVKIVAAGDTITCFLDDKQVSRIKDDTFRRGRVGVYIHPAEAGQAWANVRVVLHDSPAPPSTALAGRR